MRVPTLFAALGFLGLAACVDGTPTSMRQDITAEANTSATTVPIPRVPRTIDDDFSDFVKELPGFGGLYREGVTDETLGVVKVVMTNPSAVPEAVVRDRVATLLHRLGRPELGALVDASGVKIVRGEYDFAQLKSWYPKAVTLLAQPGVIGTDIDEVRNRITVEVETASHRVEVADALFRSGVPREAVIVEVGSLPEVQVRLNDPVRPVAGGVKIGDVYGSCTLGFNVRDSGERYFVTNSHCAGISHMGAVAGVVFHQPGLNNPIGVEVIDPPFFYHSQNPNCPQGSPKGCRYSDAAAFRYYSNVSDEVNGIWARVANVGSGSSGDATIIGYHQITGIKLSFINGDKISKVGSRTGFSNGEVTAVCASRNPGQNGVELGFTLLCQTRV